MKTTIEISDSLLDSARKLTVRERTTLRALVEEGLRAALERRRKNRGFTLRDVSFGGEGLQPGFSHDRWEDVRDAVYEERGA
jgi:hypothetical protein